ncbi:MAG: PDZ domain-containing protein, partial [SAR324 cluster bacterium]|nr:PDZ domain-containing protein [SAR324 cluster bacterium]
VKVGRYNIPWGGDIITHINKTPVASMEDLAQEIETRKSGEEITVRIIRGKIVHSVVVELVLRPRS